MYAIKNPLSNVITNVTEKGLISWALSMYDDRDVVTVMTPAEMLENWGDDDELALKLAKKHGLDTKLYRSDFIGNGEWTPEELDMVDASMTALTHDGQYEIAVLEDVVLETPEDLCEALEEMVDNYIVFLKANLRDSAYDYVAFHLLGEADARDWEVRFTHELLVSYLKDKVNGIIK